jgi:hypothetical protein
MCDVFRIFQSRASLRRWNSVQDRWKCRNEQCVRKIFEISTQSSQRDTARPFAPAGPSMFIGRFHRSPHAREILEQAHNRNATTRGDALKKTHTVGLKLCRAAQALFGGDLDRIFDCLPS